MHEECLTGRSLQLEGRREEVVLHREALRVQHDGLHLEGEEMFGGKEGKEKRGRGRKKVRVGGGREGEIGGRKGHSYTQFLLQAIKLQ